jgi:magnesium-transporting ATPase (P-type)
LKPDQNGTRSPCTLHNDSTCSDKADLRCRASRAESKANVEFKKPNRNALSMTELQQTDTTFQAAFDRERRQVAERFPKSRISADQPSGGSAPRVFRLRLLTMCCSESQGLSEHDAAEKLAQDGPNMLTPPAQRSQLVMYLMQFVNPLMVLLIVAGVLSFIVYGLAPSIYDNVILAGFIFAIVIFTCTMAFWDERKALKTMNAFRNMVPLQCTVIRDGVKKQIPATKLVVGDVIVIQGGEKVPADVRLLSATSLKV